MICPPLNTFFECIAEFELDLLFELFRKDADRVSLAFSAWLVAALAKRTGFAFFNVEVIHKRAAVPAGFASLDGFALAVFASRTDDEISILVILESFLPLAPLMDDGVKRYHGQYIARQAVEKVSTAFFM